MSVIIVTRKFGFLKCCNNGIYSLDHAHQASIRYSVPRSQYGNQSGAALVIVLIISVLLSALGLGALMATNTEIKIAKNYKTFIAASECAHAGIAEAARKLVNKKITGDGSAEWGFSSSVAGYNNAYTVSYVTVEDDDANKKMIFDEAGNPYYQIESAGIFLNNDGLSIKKRAIIKLKKKPLFQFACFGNRLIEYKNASMTDSYDSKGGGYNTALAKGNSSLGGNGDIILRNGSVIHGNISRGKDGWGAKGTLTASNTTVTGSINSIDRIDPNPLGNQLEVYIDRALRTNDNFDIDEAYLNGYDLKMTQGASVNLSRGSYYFSDILLDGGSVLRIDGAVTIFLNGGLHMGSNAQIMTNSGTPADLIIFSNSTEDIVIDSASNFFGCIYAPYAKLILKNSGHFYGAFWADEVINHKGAALHYDEALGSEFTTGGYTGFELISLREVY